MRNQLSRVARSLTGAQTLYRHLGSHSSTLLESSACRNLTSKSTTEAASNWFQGKVAVVTGGASGIGEATVRSFVSHGARVVIADIQEGLGKPLAAELGPDATLFVHTDVTKEEDVAAAVDAAVALGGRLDIMVNNAGILGGVCAIDELKLDEHLYTVAVNLTGVVLGVKHAARVMKPAGKGSIICTGSSAAVVGGIAPHSYTVSKTAIHGLVKNAAFELRNYGVRINMISPDFVPTPMTASTLGVLAEEARQISVSESLVKGQSLTPDSVARAIAFLASDDSACLTGHNLVLDGAKTSAPVGGSGLDAFVKEPLTFLREAGIKSPTYPQ